MRFCGKGNRTCRRDHGYFHFVLLLSFGRRASCLRRGGVDGVVLRMVEARSTKVAFMYIVEGGRDGSAIRRERAAKSVCARLAQGWRMVVSGGF